MHSTSSAMSIKGLSGATSSSLSTSTIGENCLNLDFAPMDPIHQWKRMPECDEFVGARYVWNGVTQSVTD